MRVTTSSLLIGAAAVTARSCHEAQSVGDLNINLPSDQPVSQGPAEQVVLGSSGRRVPQFPSEQEVTAEASKSANWLQDSLNSLTAEARAIWDEVATEFPEEMSKATTFAPPKKHTRRADSYWDHLTSGAAIQKVWVENADGEMEREIHGKLEDYNLRTKKVDPSILGVDPDVKQYSGYLDDDKEDKHLFYCKRLSVSTPTLLIPAGRVF